MFETQSTFQLGGLFLSILTVIFYLVIAAFVLYSLMALYTLLRFGRNRLVSLSVSIIYLFVSAIIYMIAVGNLNSIKF